MSDAKDHPLSDTELLDFLQSQIDSGSGMWNRYDIQFGNFAITISPENKDLRKLVCDHISNLVFKKLTR